MLTDIEQRINRMLEKDPLSENVGKRRESPSTLAQASAGNAPSDQTQEPQPVDATSSESSVQETIQADLPFGSAPARRTLGRAKSRGSVRKR